MTISLWIVLFWTGYTIMSAVSIILNVLFIHRLLYPPKRLVTFCSADAELHTAVVHRISGKAENQEIEVEFHMTRADFEDQVAEMLSTHSKLMEFDDAE